jgi:hypothetical protein
MQDQIDFKSKEHRERFFESLLFMKSYEGDHIDQYYGPALLILTLDGGIWQNAQPYITQNSIDFKEFLASGYFSTTERTMVEFAANLFNEANKGPNPTDLVPLDHRNFEICIMALRMRRDPYQLDVDL